MSCKQYLPYVVVLASIVLLPPPLQAIEGPDLWTTLEGPQSVNPGSTVRFTVIYGNNGSESAHFAYAGQMFPSGIPAPFDQMTQQQWDDLQASAAGTDTLGNTPVLYRDVDSCENFYFLLEGGGTSPDPIQPLDPGVSGSFTFDLEIPMDPPKIGTVVVTAPPSLAQPYMPYYSENQRVNNTNGVRRFGPGIGCNLRGAACTNLDDCLGPRLSSIDPPIEADLEVVNDGSGTPMAGCQPLIEFTPGKIALIQRGVCDFYVKADHAQDAGAVGVVVVNDGRCEGAPDSDDCVVFMVSTRLPAGIDIPMALLSVNDGEPIITELGAGGTVTAVMGAVASDEFELVSDSIVSGGGQVDPVLENNDDMLTALIAIFTDGFESGDTIAWSATVP